MMKKRRYQKPLVETTSFSNAAILVGSDRVGLITDEGSNAAKYCLSDLWDDDSEDEE